MYEFKVDLDGNSIEDLTYRITFNERDAQGRQAYTVRRITGADAVNPDAPGTVVAQGTTGEISTTPTGLRVWAGKAVDPLWIEPDVAQADNINSTQAFEKLEAQWVAPDAALRN
jgi:hypothetical protein